MFSSPRPPKFGSRLDFERAVLEVKWLGKADHDIIAQVARKYNLPPEFIRAGIHGLRREDYLMSTSKWWPIISQWNEQYEEAKYSVERAIAYKARTSWDLFAYLAVAISAVVGLLLFASLGVAISGISVTIGLFIALYRRGEDWNVKVEEEIHKAEAAGYPEIARDFMGIAEANPLLAYFLFKRFSKERSPHIASDLIEVRRDKKGNPVPVFFIRENVDVEYARRAAEIEPGIEFLKDTFKVVNLAVKNESGDFVIRLLTVSLRNGDLPLSENVVGCRVGLERIDDFKMSLLPWFPSHELKLETTGPNSLKEVWGALKKQVSSDKRQVVKGETCTALLGFGLSTTRDFYLATDPPSVISLSNVRRRKKHKDSLIGALPFKLVINSDNFDSVVSKEVTLMGSNWEDLIPVFVATTKYDGKRIAFTYDD